MSILRKVELNDKDVIITLCLTKEEYNVIKPNSKEFLTLPLEAFERILTTGRLGNGNRIMVPTKYLKVNNIDILRKNVPSAIFDLGNKKFLLIELENKDPGVPVFKE